MAPPTPLFLAENGGVEGPNFGVFSGPAFTHLKTAKIWNPTEPYSHPPKHNLMKLTARPGKFVVVDYFFALGNAQIFIANVHACMHDAW